MFASMRGVCLRGSQSARRSSPGILRRMESTIIAEPRIPPLLLKIKGDLKTAMKARDKARLDVLRAVIAETTNAAKTSKPVETDLQLLALLRKRIAAGEDAAAQFQAANRSDLYDKEMSQVAIVDEYAATVKLLGSEQVDAAVKQAIETQRGSGGPLNEGSVMKALFGPSGGLSDQPVERKAVAKRVKELLQV